MNVKTMKNFYTIVKSRWTVDLHLNQKMFDKTMEPRKEDYDIGQEHIIYYFILNVRIS